jgi:hypothetical protein
LPAAATTTQTVAIHLKFSNYFDYMRQPPAKSSTGAAALVKIAFAQPPSWLASLAAPGVVPPPAKAAPGNGSIYHHFFMKRLPDD